MSAHRAASIWLPPLVLMALIFGLSAMPSDEEERGLLVLIGRKAAHLGEYALLTILWWRALRTRIADGRAVGAAVVVSILYACTDEFHQSFVSGRVGAVTDVLIDSAGALGAAAAIVLALRGGVRT